ncbi:MAG: prepilin peptidase [Lachnospiraceae bacterium]
MIPEEIPIYCVIFLYGIVIGSFLNVCMVRLPLGESVVTTRSHCMQCGHLLKWYELIPIVSYVMLLGRCKVCKEKISPRYPIIEGVNGGIYVGIFLVNGMNLSSVLYCLLFSILLVASVIDFTSYEIPNGCSILILILGLIHVGLDFSNWGYYLVGFFSVSFVLELILLISKGRAMGGGDVKLMAACGLLLGWDKIVLGFLFACVLGAGLHLIRMKFFHAGKRLAMGPYLSIGVMCAALWGRQIMDWYFGLLIL